MQKERVNENICRGLNDLEMVEKALEEVDYFYCIYIRFKDSLLRYIHRISSCNNEDAQDILQDAYIKVWRNLNAYQSDISLSSWLYRIVHNETISHWRKLKTNKDVQENMLHFTQEETENMYELYDGNAAHSGIVIRNILEQLPLKYKEVLVLKYLESMSYEEISDILKVPEGTVATRINRAKHLFRKESMHLKND